MTNTATQISIRDYVMQRRDATIADWADWRDAQFADDDHKELVDFVYKQYICTLDLLIALMVPF